VETTAIQNKNRIYHKLIDDLVNNKTDGEVVFYMQNGKIESCRVSYRYTANELTSIYSEGDNKKVLFPVKIKRD